MITFQLDRYDGTPAVAEPPAGAQAKSGRGTNRSPAAIANSINFEMPALCPVSSFAVDIATYIQLTRQVFSGPLDDPKWPRAPNGDDNAADPQY